MPIGSVDRVLSGAHLGDGCISHPLSFIDSRLKRCELCVDLFTDVFSERNREQRIGWRLAKCCFSLGEILGHFSSKLVDWRRQIEFLRTHEVVQHLDFSTCFNYSLWSVSQCSGEIDVELIEFVEKLIGQIDRNICSVEVGSHVAKNPDTPRDIADVVRRHEMLLCSLELLGGLRRMLKNVIE